jgi:hypothetical protein
VTPARRDYLALAVIVILATALRLVGLPGRGEWDDDQGAELLTMLHWVRDGEVPLVGPVSSTGTTHHGAAYYWLLGPSAFLSDVNPVAVVATLVVVGIVGVAATWWLGRTVGGPLAGHVAALLMAVSPSAIGTSTSLWNSNIVGPTAALAAASGWHAWRTREPRWWYLSAAAAVLVVHGHLLAAVGVPPLVALFAADLLRRPRPTRRQAIRTLVGITLIVAAAVIPLFVYESRHDFAETRAIVDLISNGAAAQGSRGMSIRTLPVVAWRTLGWPVSGAVNAAPLSALPAVFFTVAALTIAATGTQGIARQFGRSAVVTTIWAVAALTVVAPGLGMIHPGLPNDQYHAWLDPILFAAIGVAVAWLWAARPIVMKATALAVLVACLTLSTVSMPPLMSAHGGWPTAAAAAERIRAVTEGKPTAVTGVYKTGAAIQFPLRRAGSTVVDPSVAEFLVVTCDPLFEGPVGIPCGGRAEAARAFMAGFALAEAKDCFANGPRRDICVFRRR